MKCSIFVEQWRTTASHFLDRPLSVRRMIYYVVMPLSQSVPGHIVVDECKGARRNNVSNVARLPSAVPHTHKLRLTLGVRFETSIGLQKVNKTNRKLAAVTSICAETSAEAGTSRLAMAALLPRATKRLRLSPSTDSVCHGCRRAFASSIRHGQQQQPAPSQHVSQSDKTTHFGFKTVAEELKASRGRQWTSQPLSNSS